MKRSETLPRSFEHGSTAHAQGYVPALLSERLASGGPIHEPESWSIQGAVLLCDIEDFTSHVERLSSSGPDGLEELARSLNSHLTASIDAVYAYGGDVLAVAGDSFLCVWLAQDNGDLSEAAARATQAGLAIQSATDLHPAPGDLPLRMRIGVAAGAMNIALVGGVAGRWEVMPEGEPVDQVALAERGAPAGGVVLASSAWELLATRASGEDLGAGLTLLTGLREAPGRIQLPRRAHQVPADMLAPLVPAPIRTWRGAPDTEWLAELRHVTVVMLSLPRREDAGPVRIDSSHRAVRIFQRTIVRFDAAAKLLIDNKGLTLSGVFGLPPRAHENDAERALRAAAALKEAFDQAGFDCSIGVASGRVFCGLFGNDLRREYTLHGDVTNLAARLAHAGQAEILCDERTAVAVGGRFRFRELDPIELKGRSEAVPIRRLEGAGATASDRHGRWVDRVSERQLLTARLEMLMEHGARGTIVVEGDAGVGKSALVAEAVRLAELAGARVLTAAADVVERTTGYYPWRSAFAAVLGLSAETLDAGAQERLILDHIGGAPEVERMLPLLSSVLPVAIPDNEFTTQMSGDVRADNTVMLLTRILSRWTAVGPTLLIVEDVHWMDSNSWALLVEAVRSVPALMTLVTMRPSSGVPDDYKRVLALESSDVVRLGSLTAEQTSELLQEQLGIPEVPAELTRFVEDRVAGHPFFCEALIKAMREDGVVRVERGRAVVAGNLDDVAVPSTVEGAVLSLVDRLTPGQQLSLKVAAVIGKTFSLREVREVHPVPSERDAVDEHLRVLRTLDLIAPAGPEENSYAFRHEITRDVTYNLLTQAQRRPLHRAVAEWYESHRSAAELVPHYALMAHHWSRADDPAKAMLYLEQAGQQALRAGAFREAVHFYSQLSERDVAVEVRPGEERRALWDKGEAAAHYFLGDFERSRALLERSLARLDRQVPTGRVALARGLLSNGVRQGAHLAFPVRYRDRRHSERRFLTEAVDCYKVLGQISYLDGESPGELIYLLLAGLNLGEEAGRSPQLARALANAAAITSLFNLSRLADSYAARAVRMAEQEGQSEALCYVWNLHALIEAQRGRWCPGIAASDRALRLFGEVGDYNLEAELWQTRSALHICSGDFHGAEACWSQTRELAKRNVNPQLECWSLLDEVETHLGRGATAEAADALEAALAIPTAPTDGGTLIEKHYATAVTRLREGRTAQAIEAADATIAMVSAHPPTGFHWADFTAGAVEVYVDLLERPDLSPADHRSLDRRAARGCRALRRVAWTFAGVRPRSRLLHGRLDWQRGNARSALRAWRRAESLAVAMDMDFERARARLEILRHGLAGSAEATLREDVLETFARLGATHFLRIAQDS